MSNKCTVCGTEYDKICPKCREQLYSTNSFIISLKLPSLNEYIRECRGNKYRGAKFKKNFEDIISLYIRTSVGKGSLHSVTTPVYIDFEWHESTKRRDADNIASAKKFILDALCKCSILPDDNRKYVKGFTDVIIDDIKDFVVVTIRERDD